MIKQQNPLTEHVSHSFLLCGVDIEVRTFNSSEAVERWLIESQATGLMCTVDEVYTLDEKFKPGRGAPYQADLMLPEAASARLRFDGRWTVWIYRQVEGQTYRAVDEKRALIPDGFGTWRVYWAKTDRHGIGVWEPSFDRLIRLNLNADAEEN